MLRIKDGKLKHDYIFFLIWRSNFTRRFKQVSEKYINFQHTHYYVAAMINEMPHVHVLHPLIPNIRPLADDEVFAWEVTYL